MEYLETLPDNIFSHHVESYWQVQSSSHEDGEFLEMFLPTCTFNIIFISKPCQVKSNLVPKWIGLPSGAAFIGQTNTSLQFKSKNKIDILGIRFKPFAFANIIKNPLFQFNDCIVPVQKVFSLSKICQLLIKRIISEEDRLVQNQFLNEFASTVLAETMAVDERLRAQLNYIMDRHGSMQVSELFQKFKVSKVTLHSHFVKKVGLTPKKVSQIWRMNRILQLKEEFPQMSLTKIGLEAGFYDQAHFIKDFKSIFEISPKIFFAEKKNLIKIANFNISKRFTNQYDPRIGNV